MGDVKLTPRETAELLDTLDDTAKSLGEARSQLLDAMAKRRKGRDSDGPRPDTTREAAHKKR
jgi:hypothetical protein